VSSSENSENQNQYRDPARQKVQIEPNRPLEGSVNVTEWDFQTQRVPDLQTLNDRGKADARAGTIDFWQRSQQDQRTPLREGMFEGADGKMFKAAVAVFGPDGIRPVDGEPRGAALLVPNVGSDANVTREMAQTIADRHGVSVFTVDTGDYTRAGWQDAAAELKGIPQPLHYVLDESARKIVADKLNEPNNRAVASVKDAITAAVSYNTPLDIVVVSNGGLVADRALGEAVGDLRRSGMPDTEIDSKLSDLIAIHRADPSLYGAAAPRQTPMEAAASTFQDQARDAGRRLQEAAAQMGTYGAAATDRFFAAMKEDVMSTGAFLAQPAYVPAAQLAKGLHEGVVNYFTNDAYDNNQKSVTGVENAVHSAIEDPAGTLGKAVPNIAFGMITGSAEEFLESKITQQAADDAVRSGADQAWRKGTVQFGTGPAAKADEAGIKQSAADAVGSLAKGEVAAEKTGLSMNERIDGITKLFSAGEVDASVALDPKLYSAHEISAQKALKYEKTGTENFAKGGRQHAPTEAEVFGRYRKSMRKELMEPQGTTVIDGKDLHHLRYPKNEFKDAILDSEGLFPVPDEVHTELHRLQGAEGLNAKGTPARWSDMVFPTGESSEVDAAVRRHLEHQNPKAHRTLAQANEDLRALQYDKTTREISKLSEHERNLYTENKAALTHYRESDGWQRVGPDDAARPHIDFVHPKEGIGVAVETIAKPNLKSEIAMQDKIQQLEQSGITNTADGIEGGQPLKLELDVRIPRGAKNTLEALKDYGEQHSVKVNIQFY